MRKQLRKFIALWLMGLLMAGSLTGTALAEENDIQSEQDELAKRQEKVIADASARDPEITYSTEYYISEGEILSIDMYIPNKEKYPGIRPGILFFFGGGFSVGTPLAFREQAEICAKQGYVAMSASYRILATHGTSPRESYIDGAAAWKYVHDNAAKWEMDADKIFLSGGSAGGTIASMCEPITGISPAGYVLFNPGFLDANLGPEKLANSIGTRVEQIPITNPGTIKPEMPPVLIMHGESDTTVPIVNVRQYVEKAKELGVDAHLVSYPDMTHGFFNFYRDRAHFYLTMGETLKFMEAVLKTE